MDHTRHVEDDAPVGRPSQKSQCNMTSRFSVRPAQNDALARPLGPLKGALDPAFSSTSKRPE